MRDLTAATAATAAKMERAIDRAAERHAIVVEIGGLPVRLSTFDSGFLHLLQERYDGFTRMTGGAEFEFDVDLTPPVDISADDDVRVRRQSDGWSVQRGDFLAEWDAASNKGTIRQSANAYAIDSVLRIVHTLLLAREGGFLVHAASAVRHGRAFLFAGVSGAGKTTIARLAPADAQLMTDEISYVRKANGEYRAYGTPFAGELARLGENVSAPIGALYLLAQDPENRIEPVGVAEGSRALLESILFFAQDPELVKLVFEAACEFVSRVPVFRLRFAPDSRVWEMIG